MSFQAICLHVLFIWTRSPVHRRSKRVSFPAYPYCPELCTQARKATQSMWEVTCGMSRQVNHPCRSPLSRLYAHAQEVRLGISTRNILKRPGLLKQVWQLANLASCNNCGCSIRKLHHLQIFCSLIYFVSSVTGFVCRCLWSNPPLWQMTDLCSAVVEIGVSIC